MEIGMEGKLKGNLGLVLEEVGTNVRPLTHVPVHLNLTGNKDSGFMVMISFLLLKIKTRDITQPCLNNYLSITSPDPLINPKIPQTKYCLLSTSIFHLNFIDIIISFSL